ncbi:hypothetical protein ABW19_dt0204774 [Dactylella cylindrospora]|nr:hypothetical protein ABW19_dt0204774 [Dactylella cylindrospora]
MIDCHGRIKIADFGMAAFQPQGDMFTSSCGSPNYAAPEVIRNLPYKGSAADIWSSGVILYGMLAHELPFDNSDVGVILTRVLRGLYSIPQFFSSEASNLVASMMEFDPNKRIEMHKIRQHVFLSKYFNIGPWPQPSGNLPASNSSCSLPEMALNPDQEVDLRVVAKLKLLWKCHDEDLIIRRILAKE